MKYLNWIAKNRSGIYGVLAGFCLAKFIYMQIMGNYNGTFLFLGIFFLMLMELSIKEINITGTNVKVEGNITVDKEIKNNL